MRARLGADPVALLLRRFLPHSEMLDLVESLFWEGVGHYLFWMVRIPIFCQNEMFFQENKDGNMFPKSFYMMSDNGTAHF